MIYKEDWEMSKRRIEAFWENEIIDRCCIGIYAPRKKPLHEDLSLPHYANLEEKWLDTGYRMKSALFEYSSTFFAGEAFPNSISYMGAGVLSSLIGGGFVLTDNNTIWFDTNPIIQDWKNVPDLKLEKDSRMWKALWDITEEFSKKANGNYMVGVTDLGGILDVLASLRGTEKLLIDLYDHPEEVRSVIEKIDMLWIEAYSQLQNLINRYMEGSTGCMGIWCNKRWHPLQCDISAMISPAMFERFVVPSLIRQTEAMDRAIYHLDGPGGIPHLDMILDIKGIDGIQWVPSPDTDHCDERWFGLYEKVQSKGKRLVLNGVPQKNVEKLLGRLSPKGLFITSRTCLESPENLEKCSGTTFLDDYCAYAVDATNEDSGSAIVRYNTGMHVNYSQNFFVKRGTGTRGARFMGYLGSIEFDFYTNEIKLNMHHKKWIDRYTLDDLSGGHGGGEDDLYHSFINIMKGGTSSVAPLYSGLLSALVCLKAKQSAETGSFKDIVWPTL